MEIEVETDAFVKKQKNIAKLFSPKKKVSKKEIKKTKVETIPQEKVVESGVRKKNWAMLVFVPFLTILSLVFGLASYFYYTKYEKALKTPILSEKNKDQAIIDSISRSMELPSEENPIVAAVTDVEKLREKDLFPGAQIDDQAVIYLELNKTIIYRPSSGKIVDVIAYLQKDNDVIVESEEDSVSTEPVVLAGALAESGTEKVLAESSEQVPKEKRTIRVAVYNGTNENGIADKLAQDIYAVKANANVDVVLKTNAKGVYVKTMALDLVGNNSEFVSSVASALGAEVVTLLPKGEPMPEADVLVIGGEE